MKRLVTTCDHCGKELDSMTDFEDVEFDTKDEYLSADLCSKCYEEISDIINQFCKKKK